MAETRQGIRHPRLVIMGVIGAALVAMLATSEALFAWLEVRPTFENGTSLWTPKRHVVLREWQPDSRFRFRPPAIRFANPGGAVHAVYTIDTDANGFIEPALVHPNPDLTLVFLGGSTTETMFVTPEKRFPYLVARILEDRLGLRINGVNAGKSGNNAMHSLIVMIAKVLPLRPDAVVLMHNVNDLGVLLTHGSYWNDSSDFALVRTPERSLETVVRELRDMTIPRTYRALRRSFRALGHLMSGEAQAANPLALESTGPVDDTRASMFESALEQFVAIARAWSITPVLMTQPVIEADRERSQPLEGDYLGEETLRRGGLTPTSFALSHRRFNAIVRAVARRHGAPLIDLAVARAWTLEDLYDRLHFTDTGSARASAVIAAALEEIVARK